MRLTHLRDMKISTKGVSEADLSSYAFLQGSYQSSSETCHPLNTEKRTILKNYYQINIKEEKHNDRSR